RKSSRSSRSRGRKKVGEKVTSPAGTGRIPQSGPHSPNPLSPSPPPSLTGREGALKNRDVIQDPCLFSLLSPAGRAEGWERRAGEVRGFLRQSDRLQGPHGAQRLAHGLDLVRLEVGELAAAADPGRHLLPDQ